VKIHQWLDTSQPSVFSQFRYTDHLWSLPIAEQTAQTRFDRQSKSWVVESWKSCSACSIVTNSTECTSQLGCFWHPNKAECRSCATLDEMACRTHEQCNWPGTKEQNGVEGNSIGLQVMPHAQDKDGNAKLAELFENCKKRTEDLKGKKLNGDEDDFEKVKEEQAIACQKSKLEASKSTNFVQELGQCQPKCIAMKSADDCSASAVDGNCVWNDKHSICVLENINLNYNRGFSCEGPSGQSGSQTKHFTDNFLTQAPQDDNSEDNTEEERKNMNEIPSTSPVSNKLPNVNGVGYLNKDIHQRLYDMGHESLEGDFYTYDKFTVFRTNMCHQCLTGPDKKIRCPIKKYSRRQGFLNSLPAFNNRMSRKLNEKSQEKKQTWKPHNEDGIRDALYQVADAVFTRILQIPSVSTMSNDIENAKFYVCNERLMLPGTTFGATEEKEETDRWPGFLGGFLVTDVMFNPSSKWKNSNVDNNGWTAIEYTMPLVLENTNSGTCEDEGVYHKKGDKCEAGISLVPPYSRCKCRTNIFDSDSERLSLSKHIYNLPVADLVTARQVDSSDTTDEIIGSEIDAVFRLVNVVDAITRSQKAHVDECKIDPSIPVGSAPDISMFGISRSTVFEQGLPIHSNGICMSCSHVNWYVGMSFKSNRDVNFPGLSCGHSNSMSDHMLGSNADNVRRAFRFARVCIFPFIILV
jgi:hypothetical protein